MASAPRPTRGTAADAKGLAMSYGSDPADRICQWIGSEGPSRAMFHGRIGSGPSMLTRTPLEEGGYSPVTGVV